MRFSANAIKCYSCNSTNLNDTCFTLANKTQIPLLTCNATTSSFYQFLNTTHLNPIFAQEALNATEYECVTFKKHYEQGNATQIGRGCFPRNHYVNSCQAMHTSGDSAHHLTDCEICHHDNCNSASSMVPTSVFMLLAYLVFKIYLK
ncbi:hypothetical protein FQR65_LT01809 [Abscondita terminalis]|nr:hypothetical protein FQR65_LT01809 [Abscondita terminalis]